MKKVKLDIYEIHYKRRNYQVIVFPKQRNMYVADGHPGEAGILFIDGDKEAYKQLKYAYAVLIQDPSKLLYFPCRHKESYPPYFYMETSDLILYSSSFPFRRSYWFKLKDMINKRNYKGKYVLRYDRDKLLDWVKQNEDVLSGRPTDEWCRKIQEEKYWDDDSNDVVFCQIPREGSYCAHKSICDGMKMYRQHTEQGEWLYPGYLYPDTIIKEIDREREEAIRQTVGSLAERVEEFRDMCRK